MSSPFSNPGAWDRLALSGPGGRLVLEPVRVQATGEVQEQSVPDGGTTFLAYAPREVVVEGTLWSESQWKTLQSMTRLWRPPGNNPKPAPLSAVHPQLELLRLERVYLWRVELMPYDPKEGYRYRLTLREWWPTQQVKAKKGEALAKGQGGLIGQGTPLDFDTAIKP